MALLVGAQPHGKVLGALARLSAWRSATRVGELLAGPSLGAVKPPVVALAITGIAALAILPLGIAQAPHHMPALEDDRLGAWRSAVPRHRRGVSSSSSR